MVFQLRDVCRISRDTYVGENVNLENLVMMYELSFLFEDTKLKERCREVVKHFSVEILSSPWLGQISQQCMKDLLLQKLCVDEVSVFKGLLQWGASQSNNLSRTTRSYKGLRQQIETLLPLVRFLSLTPEDFERHVMPLNILTFDEKKSILMNLKQDGNVSLPVICSPERGKRIFYSERHHHHVALRAGDRVYDKPCKVTPNKALKNINKSKEEKAGSDVEDCDSEYNECDYVKSTSELLSGLKINKVIHLTCIKWTSDDLLLLSDGSWESKLHLVIKSSSGTTVGETYVNVNKRYYLSAIFKTPLVLSSTDVYSILLVSTSNSGYSQLYFSDLNFLGNLLECHVSYGDLNISGAISSMSDLNLSVEFWCFSKLF